MPVLGRRPEVAGVDGEVDVGLGVLALGGDPLAQLGVVAGEELDLDAGLLRPLLERRLDAVVAARVHGSVSPSSPPQPAHDDRPEHAQQADGASQRSDGGSSWSSGRANLGDVGLHRSHQGRPALASI